ncbi:MAG: outer membrane beta-barrel protein [Chlamydiota bacterium]
MKKNILLFLMPLSFLMPAATQAQEGCAQAGTNSYPNILGSAFLWENSAGKKNTSRGSKGKKANAQAARESCCVDGMNFYVEAFGGANFLQHTTIDGNKTSYQTGYVFSGMLGYSWNDCGLRLEAEYAFRRNAIKKMQFITQGSSHQGHFQTSSYMGNLLWDLPLCWLGCPLWKIQPFIGLGLGYDSQKVHSSNSFVDFHQKWHHLSWQTMAGFAFPLFPHAEITLEYKFHQGGSHFYNHSVGLGFVYKFGFIK